MEVMILMNKLLSGAVKFIRYITLYALCSGFTLFALTPPADRAGFRRLAVNDLITKQPIEAVWFYSSNVGVKVSQSITAVLGKAVSRYQKHCPLSRACQAVRQHLSLPMLGHRFDKIFLHHAVRRAG